MSMRHSNFTNIQGHRVEFSRELILPQVRHFHREATSQKVQQQGVHRNGTNKGRKLPIKRKMT
ncbi:MAG: hypothetical protein APF77_08110 [Clostridia bacterium BRH_c25]|nr:MAG: hypothetical protein APF77_08110 [Clostridia bacterium BRH_c25]